MKWQELILRGTQRLLFPNGETARLDEHRGYGDVRTLRVRFDNGKELRLPNAIDCSEMLEDHRVLVLEGRWSDRVLLLGGEQSYCIYSDGAVGESFRLFRGNGFEGYWTTAVIGRGDTLLIVYENGVLVIGDDFTVRFHKMKLINDVVSQIEENRLKLVRDHDEIWYMSLENSSD